MKNKAWTITVMAAFLFIWMFISYAVPYTHDDWGWGLETGINEWLSGSSNGRFVGNFFVIIMTRWEWLKVLLMGLFMFAVPALMALLVKGGNYIAKLVCANLLVFSMDILLWRQSWGWVSGFANYGISVVFLLALFVLIRYSFYLDGKRKYIGLLAMPLCCALGMFVENLTVAVTVFAFAMTVYSLISKKGIFISVSALAGSFIGCVFMFLCIPMYGELVSNSSALGGLRTLCFEPGSTLLHIVGAVAKQYTERLLPQLFILSPSFCVIMTILPLVAFLRSKRKYLAVLAVVPAVYAQYIYKGTLVQEEHGLFAVICWAVAGLSLLLSSENVKERVILFLFALASIAPLAISNELGERLFVLPYLLVCLLVLDVFSKFLSKIPFVLPFAVLLCMQCGWYLKMYNDVAYCSAVRSEIITEAIENGDKTIIMPTEKYNMCWGRNPHDEWRRDAYRDFYGIPRDTTLIFLPEGSLDMWPDITEQHWSEKAEYPPTGK